MPFIVYTREHGVLKKVARYKTLHSARDAARVYAGFFVHEDHIIEPEIRRAFGLGPLAVRVLEGEALNALVRDMQLLIAGARVQPDGTYTVQAFPLGRIVAAHTKLTGAG